MEHYIVIDDIIQKIVLKNSTEEFLAEFELTMKNFNIDCSMSADSNLVDSFRFSNSLKYLLFVHCFNYYVHF